MNQMMENELIDTTGGGNFDSTPPVYVSGLSEAYIAQILALLTPPSVTHHSD